MAVTTEEPEASGATASDGGVAEPAARPTTPTLSPLAHLTKQSTRFGVWEVVVFRPEGAARQYLYEGKKEKQLFLPMPPCIRVRSYTVRVR